MIHPRFTPADTIFFRHPPLEPRSGGMRGTHEHSPITVIMGGPDKPGHDGFICTTDHDTRLAGRWSVGG